MILSPGCKKAVYAYSSILPSALYCDILRFFSFESKVPFFKSTPNIKIGLQKITLRLQQFQTSFKKSPDRKCPNTYTYTTLPGPKSRCT